MPTKTRPASNDVRSSSCLRTTYLQSSGPEVEAQQQGPGVREAGSGVGIEGADDPAPDTVAAAPVREPDGAEPDVGVDLDPFVRRDDDDHRAGAEVRAYLRGRRRRGRQG